MNTMNSDILLSSYIVFHIVYRMEVCIFGQSASQSNQGRKDKVKTKQDIKKNKKNTNL